MDDERERFIEGVLVPDLRAEGRRRALRIATRLTVCERIEPERELANGPRFDQSLGQRWDMLTRPLRLAGRAAMRPSASGRFPALDALGEAMPWGKPLVDDVERQLRIQLALGRPWIRIEPVLLVGAPGVGKTWLARRLGAALALRGAALELGSASDDRTLSGTARGWSNAQPAWPLVVIASTCSPNPLLVLDELDKAGGSSSNGRPHHALLSLLEPASARAWYDQCLMTACDLSQVNWIACANTLDPIPPRSGRGSGSCRCRRPRLSTSRR